MKAKLRRWKNERRSLWCIYGNLPHFCPQETMPRHHWLPLVLFLFHSSLLKSLPSNAISFLQTKSHRPTLCLTYLVAFKGPRTDLSRLWKQIVQNTWLKSQKSTSVCPCSLRQDPQLACKLLHWETFPCEIYSTVNQEVKSKDTHCAYEAISSLGPRGMSDLPDFTVCRFLQQSVWLLACTLWTRVKAQRLSVFLWMSMA